MGSSIHAASQLPGNLKCDPNTLEIRSFFSYQEYFANSNGFNIYDQHNTNHCSSLAY